MMRRKLAFLGALCLCLFAADRSAMAAQPEGPCGLPKSLRNELSAKYPGTRQIELADLDDHDKSLYQTDHGAHCPGSVQVDFFGDGKATYALVLIKGETGSRKAELVLCRYIADRWEIRLLETTDGSPVVWSQRPGKYTDVYGEKTIQATNPVIVFCGYDAWAILYSWTGQKVEKIWLRD